MKNAQLILTFILCSFISTAQLYTNQSELLLGRQGHSVAVLDQWVPSYEESNFVVSGGFDGSLVTTACEWNGQFYDMNFPRIDHTSNAYNNTKVLIAGGYDGVGTNYSSTEIFDTETEEFTATAAQTSFTLTNTPMGKVAVFRNGVRLPKASIAVSGTTITYTASSNSNQVMAAGDRITIDYIY